MSLHPNDRLARLERPHLRRELNTIRAMVRIWCRDRHGRTVPARAGDGLCPQCAAFMDYAKRRLAACPYGEDKPTCSNCRIHCYGPREREQVRAIMRHAGPRMLLRHPYLALMHTIDGRRPAPEKPRNTARPKPKAGPSGGPPVDG